MPDFDREDFDLTFLSTAFDLAAEKGWHRFSFIEAAHRAHLPLDRVRAHFPNRLSLLFRLGRVVDESTFHDGTASAPIRERVFDLFMRRFDVLQNYRDGVKALLHALPTDPGASLYLAGATFDSMRWLAQLASINVTGLRGMMRVQGLVGAWLCGLRAWEKDDTPDLSHTMAALDKALQRAERLGILKPSPDKTPAFASKESTLDDYPVELEP